MSKLTELTTEFGKAIDRESALVEGYIEILSLPSHLLSEDARTEIREGLDWSNLRISLLSNSVQAINALDLHNYPDREAQAAPDKIINELNARLESFKLAVDEFIPVIIGTTTVSEEIKI